ncbi:MAG: hypothetical protein OIF36_03175 [Alphaproteobacteria bacterium]|nr:hypothetical protein [Alphaproteobacteria bacterium]
MSEENKKEEKDGFLSAFFKRIGKNEGPNTGNFSTLTGEAVGGVGDCLLGPADNAVRGIVDLAQGDVDSALKETKDAAHSITPRFASDTVSGVIKGGGSFLKGTFGGLYECCKGNFKEGGSKIGNGVKDLVKEPVVGVGKDLKDIALAPVTAGKAIVKGGKFLINPKREVYKTLYGVDIENIDNKKQDSKVKEKEPIKVKDENQNSKAESTKKDMIDPKPEQKKAPSDHDIATSLPKAGLPDGEQHKATKQNKPKAEEERVIAKLTDLNEMKV